MRFEPGDAAVGLLFSGGLDSAILLFHLLSFQQRLRPFYVRSGFHWEDAELAAAQRVLERARSPFLDPLVELSLPVGDVYGNHWSIQGNDVPDETTPDEAVYLPGRNLLLIVKVAIWCQQHDVKSLLLGTLGTNPFPDGNAAALRTVELALAATMNSDLRIELPFEDEDKSGVMRLGATFPLGETFSCIDPREGMHCGRCNKCAERRQAFRLAELPDPTTYCSSH